jgi:periplasmic copper chaperone A
MRFSVLAPVAAAAAFLMLPGCGGADEGAPAIEVEEAWVRLPAAPGRPAAAYFTLRAYNAPIQLTGVTSDEAERIELHDSRMEDGVMRMVPLEGGVTVPAGAETSFEPGGQHAMLYGLAESVREGGRMRLVFTFEGVDPVTVQAEVRGPGGAPAGGHAGH